MIIIHELLRFQAYSPITRKQSSATLMCDILRTFQCTMYLLFLRRQQQQQLLNLTSPLQTVPKWPCLFTFWCTCWFGRSLCQDSIPVFLDHCEILSICRKRLLKFRSTSFRIALLFVSAVKLIVVEKMFYNGILGCTRVGMI